MQRRITEKYLRAQCSEAGVRYNPNLQPQIRAARKGVVRKFCRARAVELIDIAVTTENTTAKEAKSEPIFYFNDNLGGYTLEGISRYLRKCA